MEFKIFRPFPDLVYGLSEKVHGEMSLARSFKAGAGAGGNRQKYLSKYFINLNQTVAAGLINSAKISKVNKNQAGQIMPGTDGLVTDSRNLFLNLTVADCFPVFLFDPKKHVVGLVHAGWRGITSGIVKNAVELLQKSFAADLSSLRAGIGPGIQADHFEIKQDILANFVSYPEQVLERNEKLFVDLPGILKRQLLESGLKSANIELSPACTYCQTARYFSFRRDKPQKISPMMAFIGFK